MKKPLNLTPLQKKYLELIDKGYGLSAVPKDTTADTRKALNGLLKLGLIKKSKNHSKDKYGYYCKL